MDYQPRRRRLLHVRREFITRVALSVAAEPLPCAASSPSPFDSAPMLWHFRLLRAFAHTTSCLRALAHTTLSTPRSSPPLPASDAPRRSSSRFIWSSRKSPRAAAIGSSTSVRGLHFDPSIRLSYIALPASLLAAHASIPVTLACRPSLSFPRGTHPLVTLTTPSRLSTLYRRHHRVRLHPIMAHHRRHIRSPVLDLHPRLAQPTWAGGAGK